MYPPETLVGAVCRSDCFQSGNCVRIQFNAHNGQTPKMLSAMNSGPTRNRRIRCVDKDACSYRERSTRPMIVQKVEAKVPSQVKTGHKNPTLPSIPFGGKHCRKSDKCYSFISNQMNVASLRKATSQPKDTRPRASTPTRNRRIADRLRWAVGLGLPSVLSRGTADFRTASTKAPRFSDRMAGLGSAICCQLWGLNPGMASPRFPQFFLAICNPAAEL